MTTAQHRAKRASHIVLKIAFFGASEILPKPLALEAQSKSVQKPNQAA
jgi:hypothetical protein